MERPRGVIRTDRYASLVEEHDIFLCPSDYSITSDCLYLTLYRGKKNPVMESQHNDRQKAVVVI